MSGITEGAFLSILEPKILRSDNLCRDEFFANTLLEIDKLLGHHRRLFSNSRCKIYKKQLISSYICSKKGQPGLHFAWPINVGVE